MDKSTLFFVAGMLTWISLVGLTVFVIAHFAIKYW
jgi:hypothetical protein